MDDRRLTFDAIGTSWQIQFFQEVSANVREALEKKVLARIEAFDHAYSRFRSDSLVTKMAQQAGSYTLPSDAEPMLRLYQDLYQLTDGAFTPLIGRVLVDAGYDADYSLTSKSLCPPPTWDAALDYAPPTLTIKQPCLLDFGAAGKGYLVDIVAELIANEGVTHFCVDAGGDIFVRGEPIRVALEDPRDSTMAVGLATISNQSICGSAGNRRAWGQFHHTINPKTLSSPKEPLAIWTFASSALLADALSTCLALVSPNTLASAYKFDWTMMYTNGQVLASEHAPVQLFI